MVVQLAVDKPHEGGSQSQRSGGVPDCAVGAAETLIDPGNNSLMPSYALEVERLYGLHNKHVMRESGICEGSGQASVH